MTTARRTISGLFVLLALGAAAGSWAAEPAGDPFPVPAALDEQVEFWINVFARWSLSEVAIHDAVHPSLVYEIVTLPGDPGEGYARTQRDGVRSRTRKIQATLAEMERKIAVRAELTDAEKALALKISTTAGIASLRGAKDRVRSQRGLRERFRRGLEISGRYDAEFRKAFRENGLPEDLAFLPHVESSFQAAARSSAGAVGVWQFTRPAARKFMLFNAAIDERLDPVAAARGAARYLRDAHETLGDWALAVTSYNHGVEGMARAKARFGTDFGRIVRDYDGKHFGFASRNFYTEFLAAREIARDPVRFFPDGIRYEPPLSLDRVILDRTTPPVQIARAHGLPLGDLASLNPAWTLRAVRGGQALPAGTVVWLPPSTLSRSETGRAPSAPSVAETVSKPVSSDAPAPAPSPGERAAEAVARVIVHVVRRGETLFKIAGSYGVSVRDLLGINEVTERSILHPGQRLRIPLSH